MTVTEIVTGARRYRVTGIGYVPEGEFVALNSGQGVRTCRTAKRTGARPCAEDRVMVQQFSIGSADAKRRSLANRRRSNGRRAGGCGEKGRHPP